jgi:hypothetical protein
MNKWGLEFLSLTFGTCAIRDFYMECGVAQSAHLELGDWNLELPLLLQQLQPEKFALPAYQRVRGERLKADKSVETKSLTSSPS